MNMAGECQTRVEADLLGVRDVPAAVYWGIHTLRAMENFRLKGETVGSAPGLVAALASVKEAAAEANMELGLLDARSRNSRRRSVPGTEIRAFP
jgi:aspartate ammonia-lyase